MGRREIRRQPRKQEVESIVIGGEAEHQTPNFSLLQQISQRSALRRAHAILRLRSTQPNEISLGHGERLVFAWVLVESGEEDAIGQTDEARGREAPSPSESQQQQA